jgi:hypothetical protein
MMAGLALLALQAVIAFNLVCTGTRTSGPPTSFFDVSIPQIPVSFTYHVDLDGRRYCADHCATTAAIVRVTESQIVFRQERTFLNERIFVWLNRATGHFSSTTLAGETVTTVYAECRRAPFTGIRLQ